MGKRAGIKSSKRRRAKMRALPKKARHLYNCSPKRNSSGTKFPRLDKLFKAKIPNTLQKSDKDDSTMTDKQLTVEQAIERARKSTATSFPLPDGHMISTIMTIREKASKEINVSRFYAELLAEYYNGLNNGSIKQEQVDEVLKELRFLEMQYRVLIGDVDSKVFEQLDAKIKSYENNGDTEMTQPTVETVEVKETTKSEDFLSPNLKSCLAAGVTGAAVSLAFDFIFETEQTTTEMLIDAGVAGGISAVVGYAASAAFDMDDPSTFASAGLGVATGVLAASGYRAAMEMFGNNDCELTPELDALPVPVIGNV